MSEALLKRIELDQLAEMKRVYSDDYSTDDDTVYYYKLGKKLGFVNCVGSAITTTQTATFWYYRVPLSDGSETLSDTISPIVDARWDDALVFGACYYLTGEPKYLSMYDEEVRRQKTFQSIQNNHNFVCPVNRDYD